MRAHHGSLARPQRIEVEDRLKAGRMRGLVATSSLELGIDMGAIDLVVQIEAPPSVASGLQRIGRAGHTIGEASRGIIVPKFRGDLVACAAVTRAMHEGAGRGDPLSAQPARRAGAADRRDGRDGPVDVDELFAAVRRAAPFAELGRGTFEGVLDMLSGRYPSDDFAELRPRLTWDRVENAVTAREGAQRVAVDQRRHDSGPRALRRVPRRRSTVPARASASSTRRWSSRAASARRSCSAPRPGASRRSRTTACSCRRRRASRARCRSGRPTRPGRPLELGRADRRARAHAARHAAGGGRRSGSSRHHDLDAQAAENLLRYLADQAAAAGVVPDDRTLLIERCRDELGDWRVCVLSPFGGRIHAPWAMAVVERVRAETGLDVETMWTDDGFVVRFPETDEPPDPG